MSDTIGTCGNCGGRVTTPDAWAGTRPPIPRCESCGATVAQPHGAPLPMNPAPKFDPRAVPGILPPYIEYAVRVRPVPSNWSNGTTGQRVGRPTQAADDFSTGSLPRFNAMDGDRSMVR